MSIVPSDTKALPMHPRPPLRSKENSPHSAPHRRVRRKSSFVRRIDSSEECPSSHDSIFEASIFSSPTSEENVQLESWPLPPGRDKMLTPTSESQENNDSGILLRQAEHYAASEVEFLYGRGTVLDTISERRSIATMRTLGHSKSVDDMHSIPFLGHRDSLYLAKSPRRKLSFSVDDISEINTSYHKAIAMIEREAHKTLPVHEIYAEPKVPIQDPPHRPPTPEGLPSWTEHQLRSPRNPRAPIHIPGRQNRLQRFLGLPASGVTLSPRVPNPATRDRSVSAPVRMARFRPPRTVYDHISQHPFNRAPLARIDPFPSPIPSPVSPSSNTQSNLRFSKLRKKKRQQVRFTPSTAAPDAEQLESLQAIIQSTTSPTLVPLTPRPLLSPAQTSLPRSTPPKQSPCPHQHRPKVRTLTHRRSDPPSNEYAMLPCGDPVRTDCLALPPPAVHPTYSRVPSRQESIHNNDVPETESPAGPSPGVSVSSTTHLMSGALRSSHAPRMSSSRDSGYYSGSPSLHEVKSKSRWRCKMGVMCDKLDTWWKVASRGFCFYCCGYECDDERRNARWRENREFGYGGRYIDNASPRARYDGRYVDVESGTTVGCWGGRDMNVSERAVLQATPVVF